MTADDFKKAKQAREEAKLDAKRRERQTEQACREVAPMVMRILDEIGSAEWGRDRLIGRLYRVFQKGTNCWLVKQKAFYGNGYYRVMAETESDARGARVLRFSVKGKGQMVGLATADASEKALRATAKDVMERMGPAETYIPPDWY